MLPADELRARSQSLQPLLATLDEVYRESSAIWPGNSNCWVMIDRDGYVLRVWFATSLSRQVQPIGLGRGNRWPQLAVAVLQRDMRASSPVVVHGRSEDGEADWYGVVAPIPGCTGGVAGVFAWLTPEDVDDGAAITAVVDAIAAASALTLLGSSAAGQLSLQAARLSAVARALNQGLIVLDRDGEVLTANDRAATSIGCDPSTLIGRYFAESLPTEHPFRSLAESGPRRAEQRFSMGARQLKVEARAEPIYQDREVLGRLIWVDLARDSQPARQKYVQQSARATFDSLVGEHPRFREAVRRARLAAESDETVLIVGESGTGKELFAQAIHKASRRSSGPFVAVNCSAIPRHLTSSELFGYVEGAFTGARRGGAPGKFEAAHGGTIFLDEIGDMPLESQSALLRILQDRCVMRVGANHAVPIDARVIAATNRDLQAHVSQGSFRLDLYFRLCVFNILVPSLQERRSDIPVLVRNLLPRLCLLRGRPVPDVSEETLDLLKLYPWPGNVRELQNALDWGVHVTDGTIRPEHLPVRVRGQADDHPDDEDNWKVWSETRNRILAALAKAGGNRTRAAQILGMPRRTFYRHLSQLGLAAAPMPDNARKVLTSAPGEV